LIDIQLNASLFSNDFLRKAQLLVARVGLNVSSINSEKKDFLSVCKIKSETKMVLTLIEASQIFTSVRDTTKIAGDVAEVGVYMGGSAKIICEAKGNRRLHLFDTFEGLPEKSETHDSARFHKNQYSCTLEPVKRLLNKYPNVFFYKGMFPSTAGPINDTPFSFVHLDVDLYDSTKNCLEFFYPRMNKGGVIISHDYVNSKGVKTAFHEYFEHKPTPVLELADNQCLVMKS
jgi:O-methyltransferase